MSEALLVSVVLLAGWILVFMAWHHDRRLGAALAIAYCARVVLAFTHKFVIELPQGASDARVFDATALAWSEQGCFAFFYHFDPAASYVYSALLSSVYGCFGYSELAAQLINCVIGTATVAVVAATAKEVWGRRVGGYVAFAAALFPALILYSALTLREAAITFFLSVGLLYAAREAKSRRLVPKLGALSFLLLAAILHGAMIMAAIGYLVFLLIRRLSAGSTADRSAAASGLLVLLVALPTVFSLYLFSEQIFIPKLGLIGELDTETVASVLESRAQGDAAYLTGMDVSTPVDVLWQAPIRVAYLLFAPFPWNVSSPTHLLGLIDGLVYLYLILQLRRNWARLKTNPCFWPILTIVIVLAVVFAFGTSNFGTGMRHRAKFALGIILITAPCLVPGGIRSTRANFGQGRKHD